MFVHTGPIQYDAAVDPEVARQKIKTKSEVAGRANVCIFPDLNTGNNTYKVRRRVFLLCEYAGGVITLIDRHVGICKPVNSQIAAVADLYVRDACRQLCTKIRPPSGVKNKWSKSAQDQTVWRQLIAPVRT